MSDNTTTDAATTVTASTSPDAVKVTSAVKPAYRTTEAWMNFATGLVGAATSAGLIGPGSQAAQIAGLALMALAMATHAWSRTSIKNAAVSA